MVLRTSHYHNLAEGDAGKPIDGYYKRKRWKRFDRKKFIREYNKVILDSYEKESRIKSK